jgi:uncharacterized protein
MSRSRWTALACVPCVGLAAWVVSAMNPDPREFYTDPQVIALIKAIDNEDLAEIKSLKAKGVNLNAAGRNPLKGTDEFEATTPLYWAYLHKKKAAYRLLLELGADPNQEVPGHWSMMNLGALDMHDSDWLRLAIDHGGNLNSEAFSKLTPLMRAVTSERLENLKLLVKAGADLNRQSEAGSTALVDAAIFGWYEGLYFLLEAGADYKLGSLPNCPVGLTYFIVRRPVEETSHEWAWREKAIDFLEAKGVDFEPAYRKVEKKDPVAAKLWRGSSSRRSAARSKQE